MSSTVIGVARGAEKMAVAKAAGAHFTIDDNDDVTELLRALGGADVVYDPVGGSPFKAALHATNCEGPVIIIGFASGEIPQVLANYLLVKNITIIEFYWGSYLKFNPHALKGSVGKLLDWYVKGHLKPHNSHIMPLDKVTDALELLRSRKSIGKVVVTQ